MNRALVTGAAGFVGSNLSESLASSGVEVTGVDKLTDYYDPDLKRANLRGLQSGGAFELIESDIRELDLSELLESVDVVFHLAAQPGVRMSWGKEFEIYARENVMATQVLLEAARDASIDRFVYSSSSSIYGSAERLPTSETDLPAPVSPYGVSKLAGEHLCRLYAANYGVPTASLRYFTVYGPRQRPDMAFTRFIRAALAGEQITVYGDGKQSRDFTFVRDVVAATTAAGTEDTSPGSVFNVSGGSNATVLKVIDVLAELLGELPNVVHEDRVAGDARHTGADTELAERQLGYSPEVELREGLQAQIDWVQETQDLAGGQS